MAEFITSNNLNAELENILEKATKQLVIISPFIKLHSRYKSALKTALEYPKLEINVVFGKNENKITSSLSQEDFEFFREFPNMHIYYEPNLHAKFYANEDTALLSSMNLYDYSQNNNIEFGVLMHSNLFDTLKGNSLDKQATDYFYQIMSNSKLMFSRVPNYEKKLLKDKYIDSEIEVDLLSQEFGIKTQPRKEINVPEPEEKFEPGYCIRTGQKIPFNPERPFSNKGYKAWAKYSDEEYSEKYCHYSGEPSNGDTSYAKPILRKNWRKAKNLID
ncbi:MAG: phospholipase D family protein [Bacteroidota bacterium]